MSMKTKPFSGDLIGIVIDGVERRRAALGGGAGDFSRMVVRPPSLLPGDGLLFISMLLRLVPSLPTNG